MRYCSNNLYRRVVSKHGTKASTNKHLGDVPVLGSRQIRKRVLVREDD
ncbi:MAG: hypothetical protein WCL39_00485 [Armatimonadota bacterium]